jgi:hypothetical protein
MTVDRVRRFADTAGLPLKSLRDIVRDTVERTAAAWKNLAQRELLPAEIDAAIDRQIQLVAANSEV